MIAHSPLAKAAATVYSAEWGALFETSVGGTFPVDRVHQRWKLRHGNHRNVSRGRMVHILLLAPFPCMYSLAHNVGAYMG